MSNIIPLASYPKSGNTWTRMFLASYIGTSPVDINKTAETNLAAAFSRVCFDRYLGIKTSMLDPATIDNFRPEILRALSRETNDNLFVKTHDLWRKTADGNLLFPPDVTKKAVFISRNVLDIASSAASHWGVSLEISVDILCTRDYCLSAADKRPSPAIEQKIGSWSQHAQSWLDQTEVVLCHLRYEDMVQNPMESFGRLVTFCGLAYDENRLKHALELCSFKKLQAQEQTQGFRERPAKAAGLFFRKGKVDGWREELPQKLIDKLIDTHGEMMQRLRYVDAHGKRPEGQDD
ncbi:sulfotransferase domain-containing protein [Thalassospira lucentensis]|uniref:sulfotransferase domain-containing protein n=1 Tax=Thalassospira lucentensis TaxID=168935 RepID=UPI00142E63E0|nr:sulfotransferase domain-containing protein [Thalassospira lucentensis]